MYIHINEISRLKHVYTCFVVYQRKEGVEVKRVHYSWFILIVTFFSIIVAGITMSSSGVFIDPLEKNFTGIVQPLL